MCARVHVCVCVCVCQKKTKDRPAAVCVCVGCVFFIFLFFSFHAMEWKGKINTEKEFFFCISSVEVKVMFVRKMSFFFGVS